MVITYTEETCTCTGAIPKYPPPPKVHLANLKQVCTLKVICRCCRMPVTIMALPISLQQLQIVK